MARQLLLVRHATVAPEYLGRYIGATDPPVGPTASAEAGRLADWVRAAAPTRCLCSPQLRARQTADLLGLRYDVIPDLREINFGQWEALTFSEIAARFPSDVAHWATGSDDFAFPGGDRSGDFSARVARLADRIVADAAPVVLAVTHGGVIASMLCHLLGLAPRNYLAFHVRNASGTVLNIEDGKAVLDGFNVC